MKTPTPETDKFFATFADGEAASSHAEYYARLQDLERERDKAREYLSLMAEYGTEEINTALVLRQKLAFALVERDEWRAKYIQQNKDLGCELLDPNGTIWDHAQTLQRERDELKAMITKEQGVVTISKNGYVQELERERDEACADAIRWQSIAEGRGRTEETLSK